MSDTETLIFSVVLLVAFVLLVLAFWIGHWILNQSPSDCPYTGKQLRRASDLDYYTKEYTLRYLLFMRQYDNRIFDFERAAFCRDTRRIFQDAVTWYGHLKVDWSFLQKRYPGNWVSWGSLTNTQQQSVLAVHHKVDGYQMSFSSPVPSPRLIAPEYAYATPGPLYVDLTTKVLLGWKRVPETDFEVLIVTKPKGIFEPPKR